MSLPVRLAAFAALTLVLSACGKIDLSSLFSGQGNTPATPAQSTRAGELEALFADPHVGDIYAAELTYFSAYFGDEDPNDAHYGLMRIIAVHPDRITLNTEDEAGLNPRGAINDMRGDLADVVWDEDENIEIYRNELSRLIADKKILDARRAE